MQANYSVSKNIKKKTKPPVIYQYNFFPKYMWSLAAIKSPLPTKGHFCEVHSKTASLSHPHTGLENLGRVFKSF